MGKIRIFAKWLFYITMVLSFLVTNMNIANFASEELVERVSILSDKLWFLIFVFLGVLSIFFVISCIMKKDSFKRLDKSEKIEFVIKYALIVLACVATVFGRSDRTMILILILTGLAIFGDYREIEIITTCFMATLFIVTIILLLTGTFDNMVMSRTDGTIRYSLGFAHPNRLALMLVFGFYSVWLVDRKKNVYLYSILALFIGAFVIVVTDSRTAVISLVLFIVLIWSERVLCGNFKNKSVKRICKWIFVFLPIICVTGSIVLGIAGKIIPKLGETTFSIRFTELIDVFNIYGITPFGRIIYYYFDNMYVKLLFRNGYIVFAIVMTLLVLVNQKAVHNRNWSVVVMLIVVQIYGLMEQVCYNPIFIALLMYLFVPDNGSNNITLDLCSIYKRKA